MNIQEELNIDNINADMQKNALQALESALEMGKVLCELSGKSVKPFIQELRNVIDGFEKDMVNSNG